MNQEISKSETALLKAVDKEGLIDTLCVPAIYYIRIFGSLNKLGLIEKHIPYYSTYPYWRITDKGKETLTKK